MVVVLLEKVEDKVSVKEVLNDHIPSPMELICGLAEGHVEEGGKAGVTNQEQDEHIEEALPAAVSINDYAVLKAFLLCGCFDLDLFQFLYLLFFLFLGLVFRGPTKDLDGGPYAEKGAVQPILKLLCPLYISLLKKLLGSHLGLVGIRPFFVGAEFTIHYFSLVDFSFATLRVCVLHDLFNDLMFKLLADI